MLVRKTLVSVSVAIMCGLASSAFADSGRLTTAVRAEPKEELFVPTAVPYVFPARGPSWMEKVAAGRRLDKPLVCRNNQIAAAAVRWLQSRTRADFNSVHDPRSCEESGAQGVIVRYVGVTPGD
jgi:hypothetical protein